VTQPWRSVLQYRYAPGLRRIHQVLPKGSAPKQCWTTLSKELDAAAELIFTSLDFSEGGSDHHTNLKQKPTDPPAPDFSPRVVLKGPVAGEEDKAGCNIPLEFTYAHCNPAHERLTMQISRTPNLQESATPTSKADPRPFIYTTHTPMYHHY